MILTNTVQDEAILSNVGQVGEFRIRNSAKAFSILSSGLYSNKIRAIIRELSCNAVDSHIAAGKKDIPFDVHFPTQLEPHFSIRDYGVGLSHDQVTNIYTTYFESTKTNSNDFIGALGLGSKSPFSYTDNFTVTAIKDGRRGIYTAFINNEGVPSIALMSEGPSDESPGVEIQFSVNNREDYSRFKDEARIVYKHFSIRPISNIELRIVETEYLERDIIPNVHHFKSDSYRTDSIAVMGNIAYPIQVPNSNAVLGEGLASLLNCCLEIHFNIGELDFQASREGLSYIPQTIAAIKQKLEALSISLQSYLAIEADKITNLWEKGIFVKNKSGDNLWKEAALRYKRASKDPIFDATNLNICSLITIDVDPEVIERDYNIFIRAFEYEYHSRRTISTLKTRTKYVKDPTSPGAAATKPVSFWEIPILENLVFYKNDTRASSLSRVKSHFRNSPSKKRGMAVFVLETFDKKKPAKFDEFLASIYGPNNVANVSDTAPTVTVAKPANSGPTKVVKLIVKEDRNNKKYQWVDAGQLSSFPKTTHYYLPLVGHTAYTRSGHILDIKNLQNSLNSCNVSNFTNIEVFGIRKSNLKEVKKMKHWVNLEDYLRAELSVFTEDDLIKLMTAGLDKHEVFKYNKNISKLILDPTSSFLKIAEKAKIGSSSKFQGLPWLQGLVNLYGNKTDLNALHDKIVKQFNDDLELVFKKYPMLKCMDRYRMSGFGEEVAGYINMIDQLDQKEGK